MWLLSRNKDPPKKVNFKSFVFAAALESNITFYLSISIKFNYKLLMLLLSRNQDLTKKIVLKFSFSSYIRVKIAFFDFQLSILKTL